MWDSLKSSMHQSFSNRVLTIVRRIPKGETRTYKQVATGAGNPKASRAVGNILNRIWQTDHGQTVPCHRVIRSDGIPGGYAGGIEAKRHRLLEEKTLE